MIYTTISIINGYILDLILGDPYIIVPHPVVLIGKLVTLCTDRLLDGSDASSVKRRKGVIMVIVVLFLSAFIPFCILYTAYKLHVLIRRLPADDYGQFPYPF